MFCSKIFVDFNDIEQFFLQAFAFSIPWSYWHFRFGARVLGHLKFMQLLLESIFQRLKTIQGVVFYEEKPYDKTSEQFDGDCIYVDPTVQKNLKEKNETWVPCENPYSMPSQGI